MLDRIAKSANDRLAMADSRIGHDALQTRHTLSLRHLQPATAQFGYRPVGCEEVPPAGFEPATCGLGTRWSERAWFPEPVDWYDVDAVFEPVGGVAGCQDDACVELVAETVAQRDESAGVFALDVATGFDLEPGDDTIVAFDDEVDFLAVVGSPVAEGCDVLAP